MTEIPFQNQKGNPVDVSIQQLSVKMAAHICPRDHQNTAIASNTSRQ